MARKIQQIKVSEGRPEGSAGEKGRIVSIGIVNEARSKNAGA